MKPFLSARALVYITMLMLMSIGLSGCASLQLEKPRVAITRIAPPASGSPVGRLFSVDLRITNPNSVALPLRGIDYSLSINGAELFYGVTGDVPTIAAYSSETLTLDVEANLFSAPKLLMSLGKSDTIEYSFNARLDLAGMMPSFKVVDSGKIELGKTYR